MRLLSLALQNFKGHQDLTVNFGNITIISGANGTGKTSVFDAFCWLLTGKDGQGRVCGTGQKGEATIRPRQADGELLRQVEVAVTGRLVDEDGEVHTLRRVFCEVYSADKSSGDKIFKGNTTKYFINDEPVPAARYDAWVKKNIDPDRMKLTSDPAYFPGLPWQQQRALLLQIAGGVDDAAVIAAHPELKPLEVMLDKHDLEGIRSMSAAQLKLANKAIKEGVVRIDQTMKLAGNVTESDLAAQIAKQEEVVQAQEEYVTQSESALTNAKSGGRAVQVQTEMEALRLKLEAWEQRRHNKITAIKDGFRARAIVLQGDIRSADEAIIRKRAQIAVQADRIAAAEAQKEELYKEYDAEYARQFTATECPFCHQALPADKVEELRAQFNTEKSGNLEAIVAKGKQVAARLVELGKERDALVQAVEADEKKKAEIQKSLDGIHKEEQEALSALPQLEDVPEFRDDRSRRDMLARELADLNGGTQPDLAPLQRNVEEARNIRSRLQAKLGEMQANLRTLQEVTALRDDLQTQRENADAASERLRLVTQFVIAKCRMLTDKVNTFFPGLEWRLFQQNVTNDDIVETCELTMHGVGYRDLSQGEKIRAGMIIVGTLQEKLQILNPVWVDGAESITFTPEVKSQLVLLKAQENINQLKAEVK